VFTTYYIKIKWFSVFAIHISGIKNIEDSIYITCANENSILVTTVLLKTNIKNTLSVYTPLVYVLQGLNKCLLKNKYNFRNGCIRIILLFKMVHISQKKKIEQENSYNALGTDILLSIKASKSRCSRCSNNL